MLYKQEDNHALPWAVSELSVLLSVFVGDKLDHLPHASSTLSHNGCSPPIPLSTVVSSPSPVGVVEAEYGGVSLQDGEILVSSEEALRQLRVVESHYHLGADGVLPEFGGCVRGGTGMDGDRRWSGRLERGTAHGIELETHVHIEVLANSVHYLPHQQPVLKVSQPDEL